MNQQTRSHLVAVVCGGIIVCLLIQYILPAFGAAKNTPAPVEITVQDGIMTYGYKVTWHKSPGSRQIAYSKGAPSLEQARERAIAFARENGYREPQRWEFWRWSEGKP